MSHKSQPRRVVKFAKRPRISVVKAVLGIIVALIFLSLSMGSILGIFARS